DVLAAAQTGTGKTAGFTLPLLQKLSTGKNAAHPRRQPIRALILTPTRELAAQVAESVQTYGAHLNLKAGVVFGGVKIGAQITMLNKGVDILVATPGRLLDHISQRTVNISNVEVLVLDEADRMLDMGFIRDIKKILSLMPHRRQNLLFSATFSDEIKDLADGLLDSPVRVEVPRENLESELVTQSAYSVSKESKRELLEHLLATELKGQSLIFTRTKHGADRLCKQLVRSGIEAAAIHGDRSQPQRTKALAEFKSGGVRVLVATDIAARGLDIDQLPFVVNYELPNVPEDYVHRIGRTGRAGSLGQAISLVSADERAYVTAIEKLIQKRIERKVATDFTPSVVETAETPTTPPHRNGGRGSQNQQPRQFPSPKSLGGGPEGRRSAGSRNFGSGRRGY
ncbi:DEAD/DEAH box helicase, partial [Armatimonas sp.]|uniref:DEAD/DEAH box helicase n=1 Tax=Armatimonas sp. TaxID=1872638 RepID=UPI00286B081A